MNPILKSAVAAAIFVAAVPAFAGPIDAGVNVGTLGVGPQVGFVIVPDHFDARLSAGYLRHNYNTTSNGVSYDGHLQLQNVGLLGDWHPFASSFRLTAGAFYNDNKFEMDALPSGGTYTFNGTTYTAAQVGTAHARVSFNSLAPYVGFGWGNNGTEAGLHFTSDIGMMYQGAPRASITASNPTNNAQLAADVAASQAKLQSDLNRFQWYPVLQIGINYRF